MKPGPDNATPSGNGVAAQALIVLGHLAGVPRYVEAGERAVRLFATSFGQSPAGYSTLLAALEAMRSPPASVVLSGDVAACAMWHRELERSYRPQVRIFNVAGVADVPPALVKGTPAADGATAWVCRGTQCLPPMRALEEVAQALRERT
jgi:uncharacterized protein YyaL (SSP411 family)